MRINRYLASTLFTGLFVTAAMFSPAMGQEQTLQPQGAWAITKVDRSSQGGTSYCTLSRKYDNGSVLSLGRNETEEYSLAIDFQKDTFQKDKALKINLQPGPGQIRAYDMMPTSTKAVVIRLGWDKGFFDSLNKSQQMKVKIGDQNYSFAMPEIAKGQGDLQECMEGLKSASKAAKPNDQIATKDVLNAPTASSKEFDAAKADDTAATAGAMNAGKQQVASEEKGILKKFADDITAQEPQTNSDDSAPRKNFAKASKDAAEETHRADTQIKSADSLLQADVRNDMDTSKVKKAAAPELVKRPAPSAPDVAATATKLAATAPAASDAAPAAKMIAAPVVVSQNNDAGIKALQKRMDELSAENATLKQKSSTVSPEVQAKLDTIQAEKKMLQDKLDQVQQERDKKANPEEFARLQSDNNELSIKNKQLEDTLRQSQTRIAETAINTETKSMKQIVDLQSKLDAATTDNATLAKQMESLKLKQEDTGLTAVAGDWDLEQATKRYNEAEREIRRLGQQIEQERMGCNREKAQIESMLFDPAVANQKQIEKLSQLQDDLDGANDKLKDQQKVVQAQVDQQLADKTKGVEAEKAALSQQMATLQKSLADKDAAVAANNTAMTQQVASLQKALADKDATVAADKNGMSQQIASLQKALADKDTAIAADKNGMAQQIAALQKQATDAQAASADKAKLTQQMADMQKAMAARDASVASNSTALQAQIDAMKGALAQKDQQLAALNAQPKVDPTVVAQEVGKARAAADQEISGLKAQNTALTQNIEAMKVSMAAKDKAVIDAQTAAAQPKTDPAVMKQIADLQASMGAMKKDNDTLRDQNIVLQQQSQKLSLQLSDAQNNGGARADKVASVQLQMDEMKRQMATKDTQNATYQNQLASMQQDNAQLKARLSVADTDRSNNTSEVSELTRQIQQLQKQMTDMQNVRQVAPAPMPARPRSASADSYNGITPAAGSVIAASVSSATAMPVAAVQSAVLAAPSVGMGGYDAGNIQSLLQKSGLSIGSVSKASSGFVNADNFAWNDGSVKGLASVRSLNGGNFDKMVSDYIAYQKGQCGGDFASMPSPSNGSAAKQMSLYEVACVSPSQSLSSSLIFFEDQGRFIAISNQTPAADMDVAMDSRDKIAGFVRGL